MRERLRTAAALVLGCALALGTLHARAQQPLPLDAFYGLLNQNGVAAQASLERVRKGWRNDYAAMLLELVGFIPARATQLGALSLLEQASGVPSGGDLDRWYQWLWSAERRSLRLRILVPGEGRCRRRGRGRGRAGDGGRRRWLRLRMRAFALAPS